jgi:phosphoglycerol transferase MdoB-like AlkP superfamily enzyme
VFVLPTYVVQLLKKLGLALIMLSVTRVLFFVVNHGFFPNYAWTDFLAGIWMDCIAIGIWFIPFYTLYLLPNPYRYKPWWRMSMLVLFGFTLGLMLAFNMVDIEYYKHTAKRSTADLITIMGTGDDLSQLIGAFLRDFWWILAIYIALMVISIWLYRKVGTKLIEYFKFSWLQQTVIFILGVGLLFIMGRGGLGLRPADALTAAQFTRIENTGLVLNTPLTVIKTFGKASLVEVDFFILPAEEHKLYNPIKSANPVNKIGEQLNVMVIILESFGDEWMGKKTGGPYTPFLDSLIDHSLYFSNAFANGKKSIEAVPAIFAGIPSLQNDPYITSHYGTNTIDALPAKLKRLGYSSAFFHGATNGSMKFDEFSVIAGFDRYYGRREYNNEAHSDGHWGILDEYFFPWTVHQITTDLKEPFIAGLFTLSSHHPYFIPDQYRDLLPKGPAPIASSIAYTDMSLRIFFNEAKKQPWYENTIFVLCADHTPACTDIKYCQRITSYQIPIVFFDPLGRLEPGVSDEIFSHIDIYPTLLDLLGYEGEFYTFGSSFFDKRKRYAVNFIQDTYHLFNTDYVSTFSDGKVVNFHHYKEDPYMTYDSLNYHLDKVATHELILKGIIQRYNRDLIHNKMTIGK